MDVAIKTQLIKQKHLFFMRQLWLFNIGIGGEMEYLDWSTEERVATITITRPPANALSSGLIKELDYLLDQIETNAQVMLTSDPITGVDAFRYGLANHSYPQPELLENAYILARKLVSKARFLLRQLW
jgi:enoyl-CoA hydratase/carnithine racemase